MIRNSLPKFCAASVISFVALSMMCSPAFADPRECSIAIVKSSDRPQYNTALKGFTEVMAREKVECNTVTYDLGGKKASATEAIIEQIRAFGPDAILTVGTHATSIVSKNIDDIPIVFSMVLYPVASDFVSDMNRPGGNLTGAAMDVPIARQFKALLEIVPRLRRVGVLYSPEETQPIIDEARRVASSMNLELLAEQVNSETEVPDALRRLDKRKMDVLWSVADGNVFTRPSTKFIIKYVVSRGIPFMGCHNGFVKAGALVALSADYRDSGRQSGEIVVRILNGDDPGDIPVATPRTVDMSLNLQVAGHIKLRIPQKIIDKASEVVR